jgi:mono/diheme cytochrome c family protein
MKRLLPYLLLALVSMAAAQTQLSFVGQRASKLRFPGSAAFQHRLQCSTDLINWQDAPASAAPVSATTFEAFDGSPPTGPKKFFRIASVPATPQSRVQKELGLLGEPGGSSSQAFTMAYPESLYAPANDPNYGAGYSIANRMTDAQLATARYQGLAAWRRIGNHGGCASCHSPDGFDLALIGYSDADIVRRSLDHVTSAEAQQIVTWIKALRQIHHIERPLHPLNFRPLQPGMEVLPGATHTDRDLAFGQYLNTDLQLIWAKDRIESRAQAQAAQAQLLALDLRKLRIGIPFDRWSEDHSRGAAHQSASEWIPMMGVQPKAGQAPSWHALHDAYLADPSDANFWAYYDQVDAKLEPIEPAGFAKGQQWSLLKYKAIQVAQHMLRHQTLTFPNALHGTTGGLVANRLKVISRNPLFVAGDHVRRFPLQADNANPSTLFPSFLAPTLPTSQTTLRDQNENFFRVWFWMGWAQDPALLLSDTIFQTCEGDYLYASLIARYKVHHAFVLAKTSVHKANAAAGFFNAAGEGVAGHGKWAAFNPFMVLHHSERNRNEPGATDPRRVMHDRMFSNTARMWIYLVHADLEATGTVFSRELVRGCIRFCRAWLDQTEPTVNKVALDAVIANIETRLNTATELRTNFNTDDLSGALPFVP